MWETSWRLEEILDDETFPAALDSSIRRVQERACKRLSPAVDILLSWSRCFHQLAGWSSQQLSRDWVGRVVFQKALSLDRVYRQQIQALTAHPGEAGAPPA